MGALEYILLRQLDDLLAGLVVNFNGLVAALIRVLDRFANIVLDFVAAVLPGGPA